MPSNDPPHVFVFADLAGFTALTEAHGDDEAAAQVELFVRLTEGALNQAHGGELIKSIGDAVMLHFDSLETALDATHFLLNLCQGAVTLPLVRVGMHNGSAVRRGDDWFGAGVNIAARVAGQAAGGQVLATADLAEVARARSIDVSDLGAVALRNVTEPVELFDLALGGPVAATSVDPVCRMQVAHGAAAGRLRHGGHDYWFCSLDCAQAFTSDPALYTPNMTEE